MSETAVQVRDLTVPSTDGTTQLHARVWSAQPLDGQEAPTPRAVLQLVHGMCEYIERYDEFARFLVTKGFLVFGHDHIGHGQSVADPSGWGCLPAKTGKETLIEDVHAVRQAVNATLGDMADVPRFIFGHSMGSFVTRAYLARHAEGLSGAIICGTGEQPAAVAKMGSILAHGIAGRKGDAFASTMLNSMADGAYSKAIKDARTPFDWLSHNQANVDAYIADPACGYMFTAGGYASLMDLLVEISGTKILKKVPKELPILLVAGLEDPVGNNGKAVTEVFKNMKTAGLAVQLKLFPHMRHEILNEDGKQAVFDTLLKFLEENI